MQASFREITSDDASGLTTLWREAWSSTYGATLGQAALLGMLADLERNGTASMLPGSDERGYCLASGHEIYGSVIIAERRRIAYLWGMYVHPRQQRIGWGSRLLLGAAARIRSAPKVEIRVLLSSSGAVDFYRKHSFMETGTENVEILETINAEALVMQADTESLKALSRTSS